MAEKIEVELSVAGVSFRKEQVGRVHALMAKGVHPPLRLVAEPTNQYDPNAVRVEANTAETGDPVWEQIGYIPKKVSKELSEALASNDIDLVEIKEVGTVKDGGTKWVALRLRGNK